MMIALIFALAPLTPIILLLGYLLGGRLLAWLRIIFPRNLWYPTSTGQLLEARETRRYREVWGPAGEILNDNSDLCYEIFMHQAQRFMIIGLDLETARGPLLTRRKVGRIALMALGGEGGMKTLEWFEGSQLANEGFHKFFRRIEVQDTLKQQCEERAQKLLDDDEEEAQEN